MIVGQLSPEARRDALRTGFMIVELVSGEEIVLSPLAVETVRPHPTARDLCIVNTIGRNRHAAPLTVRMTPEAFTAMWKKARAA